MRVAKAAINPASKISMVAKAEKHSPILIGLSNVCGWFWFLSNVCVSNVPNGKSGRLDCPPTKDKGRLGVHVLISTKSNSIIQVMTRDDSMLDGEKIERTVCKEESSCPPFLNFSSIRNVDP